MKSGGMSIGDPLVRLARLAVHLVQQDLRARHRHLEPFATHLLDQHGQLELPPAADLERLARLRGADLDRDVAEHLALEARLDLAARDVLALAAGQRGRVHPERHPQGRRVDVEPRQGARIGGIGQRVADRDLGQTGDRDDVARPRFLDVDPIDAVGGLQAGDGPVERDRAAGLDRTRRVVRLLADDRDPLPDADRAVPDAPDRHPPDVIVRGQVRDEQLERVARLVSRRRGDLDEQVEQRVEVRCPAQRDRASRCPPSRSCRRPETRSGARPRRGP